LADFLLAEAVEGTAEAAAVVSEMAVALVELAASGAGSVAEEAMVAVVAQPEAKVDEAAAVEARERAVAMALVGAAT